MEIWCMGMDQDGYMVGSNFDWKLFGHEVDPLVLILELNEALQTRGTRLTLQEYQGLEDLVAQVSSMLQEV